MPTSQPSAFNKWAKKLLLLLLLVGVAIGLKMLLEPKPELVDIAVIERGPLSVSISEEGTTRIQDIYQLVAPVSGNVLRFPLEVGDQVLNQITVVAEIEPALPDFINARQREELQANLEASKATVRVAEAQLSQARLAEKLSRSEYKRLQALDVRTLVPKSELEAASMDLAYKGAAVTSAQAELDLRRKQQQGVAARLIGPEKPALCAAIGGGTCVQILSPADGVVLEISNQSERVVRAGEKLIEIGDPANLEIVVELLSSDAVKVKPEDRVEIERWGGEGNLSGRVRSIEPTAFKKVSALGIEEQRVNTLIDLDPQQPRPGLGHNYRVYARIVVWSAEDVLQVPLGALFRRNNQWATYKVVGDEAVLQSVEIGHWNEDQAEVVSGLEVGDQVVLHPGDTIGEGVKVIVRQ